MRLLARLAAAFAALVLSLPAAAQVADRARVEAYVDGVMRQAMQTAGVAGGTVAIVQDGRVLLAKGYGLARVKPYNLATDADTLFQVASISKTPVYLALMQLAEAGKLSLDDPANKHLPRDLRIPDQGFRKPVRIRDLMSHSAGFEDSALGHLFVDKPERLTTIERYLTAHRVERVREPGIQLSYSNYALALLGVIVATKNGTDFPTAIERRVLRPLGMLRATYREPYAPALGKRLGLPDPMPPAVAINITQQLTGGPGAWREQGAEWTTMIAPAGGMRASANDMATYLLALTDPAQLERAGVLKAAAFAGMMKPSVPLPAAVHHGFMNYRMPGNRLGFGHGGAMAFGASDLVVVPDLKLGIFISTNGLGGFAFANEFARRYVEQFAPGAEPGAVRTAATRAAAKRFAGDWTFNRRAYDRTERLFLMFDAWRSVRAEDNGDLIVAAFLDSGDRFQPIGNDTWRSARRLTTISFSPDADGRMTLWTSSGTGSAQRAGWFERPVVVLGLFGLALIAGIAGFVRFLIGRQWRTARGHERRAVLVFGAAALAWVVGLAGVANVLAAAANDGGANLLFTYPGTMVWFAWIVALAVGLTLLMLVGVPALAPGGSWSSWRKARFVAALAIFAAAAIAAWRVGLVGYSGF